MNPKLLLKRLLYGGSSRLDLIEIKSLEAVLAELQKDEAQIIKEQLKDLETVQKTAGNRMVCMWYQDSAQSPLLEGGDFCLARLLIAEEKKAGYLNLVVHHGRLQSFEYSPDRPKHEFSISSVEIRPQKTTSVASAIDRLEHPKEKS